MKNLLLILLVSLFFSCDKQEPSSKTEGQWKLVKVELVNSQSDDYTGDFRKLSVQFDGDSLYYDYATGINFNEVISETKRKLSFQCLLNINNKGNVKCDVSKSEQGIVSDTTIYNNIEDGDYDFTAAGGSKYDLRIVFGNNKFYLIGTNSGNESNILYAIKGTITKDSMVLRYDYQSYQPASAYIKYLYTFHKVSN